MKITKVQITKLDVENKIKAFASITIDDSLTVNDIKIVEIEGKLYIVMPRVMQSDGFFEIVHPINTETKEMIQNTILEEYKK